MKLWIATLSLGAALATPAFADEMPAAFASAAPATEADAPVIAKNDALLRDFGGHDGLVAIVDDFAANLLADPATKPFFEKVKQKRFREKLVEQFCHMLNGGCAYTGRSMKDVHQDQDIREGDFFALVEDLQKAMTKHNVPFAAQNRLLAALAPMHRQIVKK